MKIIQYKPKYAPSVFEIFTSYPKLFPQPELEILKEDLRSSSNSKNFKFIAIDKKKTVGFTNLATCHATDYSWQVSWLAVHPEYRSRGISSRLINMLFRQAKKIGLKRVFVETCSCGGEKPARAFYEKNGFEQIALLPDFYGEKHSKVIYQKNLVN